MLKWIDAAQSLSVQVHPDEAACQALGKGRPKTEAWYIVDADPNQALLMGHYPGLDAASLRQAVQGNTLAKWLYETQPRQGDIFLLNAGTIHAIGAGFLLLEVQQPSDTTFRLYDWGRVGADGQPRQLHLDEAAASIHFDRPGAPKAARQGVDGPCFALRVLSLGSQVDANHLRVFVADRGPCVLDSARGSTALRFGDCVVAEVADGPVSLRSGSAVLLTEPR